MKVYQKLAQLMGSIKNCEKSNNTEWLVKHFKSIEEICQYYLPHGSGFDCGTKLNFDKSTSEKLVLTSSYHHMDDNGMYDGWSELTITVKPSLQFDFNLIITGLRRKNRFDIDYMYETFDYGLRKDI